MKWIVTIRRDIGPGIIGKHFQEVTTHTKVCLRHLETGQKLERGRAGAFLFWPTSFGETLPIPGAEKMLTPQNSLHNLS